VKAAQPKADGIPSAKREAPLKNKILKPSIAMLITSLFSLFIAPLVASLPAGF